MLPSVSPKDITDYRFTPENITLSDDGFHGADTFHFVEWWYFDALFDNGYSAQMSIRVVNAFGSGIVFSRLDIYKHGILLTHNQEAYALDLFSASSSQPVVYLKGKQILYGYIDEQTGVWIFDVSLACSDASADLCFVGVTQGWKGQLPGGDWWGVILPQATVTGVIRIDTQAINVSGIGYHDHNWEVTALVGFNFGWFWGKFNSEHYAATWSTILSTRITREPILIINTLHAGYINIPSSKIEFTAKNYSITNGLLLPYSFTIKVHTQDINIMVDMEVVSVHHDRVMGVLNYWRYHVKCTGFITIYGETEPVNSLHIGEFFRFR